MKHILLLATIIFVAHFVDAQTILVMNDGSKIECSGYKYKKGKNFRYRISDQSKYISVPSDSVFRIVRMRNDTILYISQNVIYQDKSPYGPKYNTDKYTDKYLRKAFLFYGGKHDDLEVFTREYHYTYNGNWHDMFARVYLRKTGDDIARFSGGYAKENTYGSEPKLKSEKSKIVLLDNGKLKVLTQSYPENDVLKTMFSKCPDILSLIENGSFDMNEIYEYLIEYENLQKGKQ